MWVRPCCEPVVGGCDDRPLILRDAPIDRGSLVDQLIEADRWRHVIDVAELASLAPEHSPVNVTHPIPPEAAEPAPTCDAPPPDVVERVVRQPIYLIGTLLDVLA